MQNCFSEDAIDFSSRRLEFIHRIDIDRAMERLSTITDFAASLCATPIAFIALTDARTPEFVSKIGFDLEDEFRDFLISQYVLLDDTLSIIPDLLEDPRLSETSSAGSFPRIRFYAGIPLISEEGTRLGVLAVIDPLSRANLEELQVQGLKVLASAAIEVLKRRRATQDAVFAHAAAQTLHDDQEARFQVLADAMPHLVWSTLPDGYHDYFNSRWYEFTGVPDGSTDGEGWNGLFHPADQENVWTVWRQSLATGEPYEIEYRLRNASGEYQWMFGRALPMRNSDGDIVRWFGTCTNIHEQKLVLDQRELISRELNHRIKNIFALVSGLISLTTREHPNFKPIAQDLRARLMALGRAHDYVTNHPHESKALGQKSTLRGMLEELLAPYHEEGVARFIIEGDDFSIDERVATPLALTFHELATNATKYGAFSTANGRLHIDVGFDEGMVEITWTEVGASSLEPPQHTGFGTRLIDLSIERQLGGKINRTWGMGGLIAKISIPLIAIRDVKALMPEVTPG